MSVRELIESARASNDPSLMVKAVPYTVWLGIGVEDRGGELTGRLTYDPKLIGNQTIPALHGGTLGALLESTCLFTLLYQHTRDTLPRTINITVDYLRSAQAKDTFAAAKVERIGRRVASLRAFAWQDRREEPIAAAVAHFLVWSPE